MSNLVKSQLEKHLEILNRKLDAVDVSSLGKRLSEAKAFLASNPSKRLTKSLTKEIESLNEQIKSVEPDKQLVKVRDNTAMLIKLMDSHPNYEKRKRKTRTKKAK